MKISTIPMLQMFIMGMLMLALEHWLPMFRFDTAPAIGLAFVTIGLVIIFAAVLNFRLANTTVNPMYPQKTSLLVVKGVYSFSRNPMYLGFLLLLIGWGFYLGTVSAFIVLPVFVWIMTCYQIIPEEKILRDKFTDQYHDYEARVRRWL